MNGSCAARLCFGRERRLRKGSDFERVFRGAHRSSDRYFTVLAARAAASPQTTPRLGLAVGKKRIRRAVARNRIKRLVRESFRHHAHLLPAVDVVVLSRSDGTASAAVLRHSLEAHWRRLGKGVRR